jgi:bla regulator protein blaR1
MIANTLSEMCKAIAPAVGNHLWQSTGFAIAAGLLTLALRNNQARTRYLLWLAASAKFLILFSLLAGVGSHIAWWRYPAGKNAGVYIAMDQLSQPFSQSRMPLISETTPATHSAGVVELLAPFLAAVWLCGIAAVVLAWHVRWRRISVAIRKAVPLREGREVESLRRLERATGMSRQIEMRVSRTSLEPGIFGIFRPVLVWPQGISERLGQEHLEAILAHELCHARRRDNLSAAAHMLVEAIFWFHPVVWWMGVRLLQERERACDEHVLEMGSDRQTYAESILKICEFCVGSPLDFVSGVTGADLKKRIVHIMTKSVVRKLGFSKKLLLSAAGLAAVAVPIVFGAFSATRSVAASQAQITRGLPPVYEAVSIKSISIQPRESANRAASMEFTADKFIATNVTLQTLIKAAYRVEDNQISEAPNWLSTEKFDIGAKWDKSVVDALQELGESQLVVERRRMLQEFLADRFKLALHREFQHFPVYGLVIAKNGPKFQEAKPGDTYPNGFKDSDGLARAGMMYFEKGQLIGQGVPIALLVRKLSGELSRELGGSIIEDKTGLKGNYDFTLHWAPDESQASIFRGAEGSQLGADREASSESAGSSIFTALQEQLGLKLESQGGPAEILVIDHVEEPVEREAQDTAAAPLAVLAIAEASIKPNKNDTPMAGFNIKGKSFSAVMFKPDRFMATNFTLHQLIRLAYGVQDSQILSGPNWLNSAKYDVDAKIDSPVADGLNKLSADDANLARLHMVQTLLADHFKLMLHRETKELPVYALVVADGGPRLQAAKPGDTYPDGIKGPGGRPVGTGYFEPEKGKIVFQGGPLSSLVQYLSDRLGQTVLDKTGLIGNYDFALQWAPILPGASSPSILDAVHEQLGLRLEQQNAATEVLVVDRAEKPSEN